MCSFGVDSAGWTEAFAVEVVSATAPPCARCAARAVADVAEEAQLARAGLRPRGMLKSSSNASSAGAMGGLSALALCATAQTPQSQGARGGARDNFTDPATASVGDKRRRARTKAKDRVMIPHATDPTRVHIHCINMCGVLYLTKTREEDKVAWTKVLRRLNAHESKRCRKKKARLSPAGDKNLIASMALSKMGALTAAGTAANIGLHHRMAPYPSVPRHGAVAGSALLPMYHAERAGGQGVAPSSYAATARMHAEAAARMRAEAGFGLLHRGGAEPPMNLRHRISEQRIGAMSLPAMVDPRMHAV